MNQNCPICYEKLEVEEYSEYGIGTIERYAHCKSCGKYSEEYAYGNSRTTIGGVEVYSHYKDNKDEIMEQSRKINELISVERGWIE